MNTVIRLTAALAATALVAVPLTLAAVTPAHADVDRSGPCAAGRYELSVDRERRGFEVDGGLEGVDPGSRWILVLRHNGSAVKTVTRTVDGEGDVDVEAFRSNTAGKDTFTFSARQAGTDVRCRTSITVR